MPPSENSYEEESYEEEYSSNEPSTSSSPIAEDNYGAGVGHPTYTLMDYVAQLSDRYDILRIQAFLEDGPTTVSTADAQISPFSWLIFRVLFYIVAVLQKEVFLDSLRTRS